MYRLTARRLSIAESIFNNYLRQFENQGAIDAVVFEGELKRCWDVGPREIKDIMIDGLKKTRYNNLIRYYMQHVDETCICSEYKHALGISN